MAITASSALDALIGDMTLTSEALPHGNTYDWAYHSHITIGNNPSYFGYSRLLGWGTIYESAAGNRATNTRVEVKDFEVWVLSKSTGQWSLVQNSPSSVSGGMYVENFVGNVSKPASTRQEADGGTSAVPGSGYDWHFWTDITGPKFATTAINASDVAGVITSYQARLVVNDPTQADDRASARYVGDAGADYWNTGMTANADAGIGRFKLLTNDYQTFTMSTLTSAQLLANLPTAYLQQFGSGGTTALQSGAATTAAASTVTASSSTSTKAATVATPVAYDVSRFYDTVTGDHFYTASSTEKAQVLANAPGLTYEGASFATPTKAANTQDVFRFFDVGTGTHFLTASTAERDSVLAHLPTFQYEGVVFEAYTDTTAVGAVTLERFFNTATNLHHYALPEESQGIRAGAMGANWVDEGAGFVVHAPTGKSM